MRWFVAENEGGRIIYKVLIGTKHGEVIGISCMEILLANSYGACMAIEQEMNLTNTKMVSPLLVAKMLKALFSLIGYLALLKLKLYFNKI